MNPNWVQLKMPSTNENYGVAVEGGQMAGKFRKETEAKGIEMVSKQNYLKVDKKEELPDNNNQV